MKTKATFIPIGVGCPIANYLRKNKMRRQAFPFDWNVTPVSSAISLIQNGFADFMEEENLVFLAPQNRLLFEENGIDLKVMNEVITPVIDRKYKILFAHDFTEKGKEDLPVVKEKYERRIHRLKQLLNKSAKLVFVHNLDKINDWQFTQYELGGIQFPIDKITDLHKGFNGYKKLHNNIDFISLDSLRSSRRPLVFRMTPESIKKPLRKLRARLCS